MISFVPQSFRKGDLVEIQVSFMVVSVKEDPLKGKQCKMVVVLQSMSSFGDKVYYGVSVFILSHFVVHGYI